MKHFVFKNSCGDYELVYSQSLKQAEKDMGCKCVAAFIPCREGSTLHHGRRY